MNSSEMVERLKDAAKEFPVGCKEYPWVGRYFEKAASHIEAQEKLIAELRSSPIMTPDPSLEILQKMYEAMFESKWTGADAPMIGAAYDAAREALSQKDTP